MTVVPFAAGAVAAPAGSDGRADADALRAAAASTGAIVVVRDGDSVEHYGSGTTQFGADDVPDGDDQFRVGSNTKMFVSTVLLQLVDEGRLELDAPIGDYLPGLVTGKGIDETQITVRELLQHTSGLADNLTVDVIFDPTLQWFPPTPEQMVSFGLRHGSQFEPGTEFTYSNTGYTILGLLVEKLTGQRVGEAIEERITAPLGLDETSYAYAGMKEMQGPHFRGYLGVPPLLFEVSGHEPGLWAGAGALVSSGTDLTAFVDALLDGELLSDEMLDEMQATFADSGYGLGIAQAELSCGIAWGHTGHVPGYTSFSFSNGKGESVFAAINTSATDLTNPAEEVAGIINSALCGPDADGQARLSEGLTAELTNAADVSRAHRLSRAATADAQS